MRNWKKTALHMKNVSKKSIKQISDKTGKSEEDLKIFFKDEKQKEKDKPKKFTSFQNMSPNVHKNDWDGTRTIKFGLIGDTHLNSKYTQITYLHEFYKLCAQREIGDIYHTGDIDEGEMMRVGHQYDCYTQGADDHIDEIVSRYPKENGVLTYFITGNHDSSIYKRSGTDIGKTIGRRRKDMLYLGRDCARVELTENCILELRHPWDGSAYAISYKPQKMIEAMEADSKPNILAIGHYHKLEYLFYRNIHSFQTGCFQMQTPFTRGRGISVHIGGWIVTAEVDDNGYIQQLIPELIPFYKGIEEDYKNWTSVR